MGLESEVSDLPRRWREMLRKYGLVEEGSPEASDDVDDQVTNTELE